MDGDLKQYLREQGYWEIHDFKGNICALFRFMFTVGVCVGISRTGYEGRFCFDSLGPALGFIRNWDGVTPPTVGVDGCVAIKGFADTSPQGERSLNGTAGGACE